MDDWDDELTPSHLIESLEEKRLSTFCYAAQGGDIKKMQKMLDNKLIKDVNMQSPKKKETALHYACRAGLLEVVKFLVLKGADVNLKDIRGKHSLHLSSSGGYLEAVKYLVEQKALLDIVDKYNRSCLHWAAMNKHYNVAEYLIEAGSPVVYTKSNWQPLHEAVKSGDMAIVELLVAKGAPVNAPVEIGKGDPVTPLHVAAREGHTDCLMFLLKHKAVVNAINQGKQTPLHEAAFKGSKECCHQLVLHGADPHARNNQDRPPLLEACNQGHIKCAILLLDAGSFINRPDRTGDAALHHLLRNNQKTLTTDQLISFTDVLLQYGANPKLPGREDDTPKMLAKSMIEKDVLDVIRTAREKPRSLLLLSKIACRRIVHCDYDKITKMQLPRNLQIYLKQNTSYFSGW